MEPSNETCSQCPHAGLPLSADNATRLASFRPDVSLDSPTAARTCCARVLSAKRVLNSLYRPACACLNVNDGGTFISAAAPAAAAVAALSTSSCVPACSSSWSARSPSPSPSRTPSSATCVSTSVACSAGSMPSRDLAAGGVSVRVDDGGRSEDTECRGDDTPPDESTRCSGGAGASPSPSRSRFMRVRSPAMASIISFELGASVPASALN